MRAALLSLLVLAGCKTPEPPDSFGVDLTVSIDAASQAGLAQVLINVTGAEEYLATLPASAFPNGAGKLHYVPGAHSGVISIGATAQDAAGTKLGAGNSGDITLLDGKGVAASLTITPGGNPLGDGGAGDGGDGGLKTLGTMCGFDNECDSGHCVDGFCCGVPSCGQCQNCGSAGTCEAVVSKDDNSGMTCNGQKSCDAAGTCKDRWVVATTQSSYTFAPGGQAAGVGNLIFLEGHSPQAPTPATPTYVFDTTNSMLVIQNGGNNDICACGLSSYMFPAGTKVCEFGNTASCIDSAAASPRSWGAAIAGYTGRSDGAWAAVGTKIYGTGGNSHDKTLSIYDTLANSWSSGPDAPFGLNFTAGGATSTQFFVIGQTPINTNVFIAFTPSTNTWTQLPTPPGGGGIYREYMPEWRGKLVAKSSQALRTFDLTSMTWDAATIPLPTAIGTSDAVVAVAGTPPTLFIIGDDATSTMNIFKYNL